MFHPIIPPFFHIVYRQNYEKYFSSSTSKLRNIKNRCAILVFTKREIETVSKGFYNLVKDACYIQVKRHMITTTRYVSILLYQAFLP
jgi:hypothetical protein